MTSPGVWRRIGRDRLWRLLGMLVLAASAAPVLWQFLGSYPREIWQVDLEVYREGARSLVDGRQVYGWLTDGPQYLPFTYPPFSALAMTPLLLVPFQVAGWVWSVLQVVLLWICSGIAFAPALARFGVRAGLAQGAVAAVLVQLQPIQDGIRFGQINAVVVTWCLLDITRREARWWPRGSPVGLAAAVKLTPALFWVHWAVTRNWRALAVSVVTGAGVTAVTALVLPSASAAFWLDALLDPARLGPNNGTSNQSIRGVLLRLGLPSGAALTLTWLAVVAVVAVLGFRLAARFDRLGDGVAVVATVGLLAVLVSPVSWIHHLQWAIAAIAALLGDGRDRRRQLAAAAVVLVLYLRIPWWGQGMLPDHGWRHAVAVVEQNSYCLLAVATLAGLWWLVARPAGRDRVGPVPGPGAQPLADPARPAAPVVGAT